MKSTRRLRKTGREWPTESGSFIGATALGTAGTGLGAMGTAAALGSTAGPAGLVVVGGSFAVGGGGAYFGDRLGGFAGERLAPESFNCSDYMVD